MKKCLFSLLITLLSITVTAQGNSGTKGKSKNNTAVKTNKSSNPHAEDNANGNNNKGKGKQKSKQEKTNNDDHDRKVWDGVGDIAGCGQASKNQPTKVRQNFTSDYPNAVNVRWTKCRGDWTATFGNGIFISTAIYHANGDRRDTRTPIQKENIPRRVLDEIFKQKPVDSPLDGAIKIEVPNAIKEIFRIKNIIQGKPQYNYFDADGAKIDYHY
ncbi:MAG: hypothetical protein RIR12_1219 [Bacteroidota bacterium]|jgi:hypothetical protein